MGQKNKDPMRDRYAPLLRELTFERSAINEAKRTIEMSISSEETVVQRWWSNEVLGHQNGEIRMERLSTVGSFLFAHGRDPQYGMLPIGKISRTWLDKEGKKLRAEVTFDTDERSEILWQKVLSGSLRGVSIRYKVYKWLEVEPGATERGFQGPVSIAVDWEPIEVSLEPTPADPAVGVGRSSEDEETDAADVTTDGRSDTNQGSESKVDEKNKTIEQTEGVRTDEATKTATPDAQAVRAAQEGERARCAEITSMCRKFGMDPEEHIGGGRSVEEVRKMILEKLSEERKGIEVKVTKDESDKFRAAAIDALVMRTGAKVDKPVDGASDLRGMSLFDLAREICERNGISIRGLDKMKIAERAIFGTSDFPEILANTANKTMMIAYTEVPTTYQQWVRIVEAADFKEMTRLQLSEAPDLDVVSENAEYKHSEFSEAAEKYKILTYGKLFSISRQAIINDDLGALTRIPSLFGAAAARKVNALVYGILIDNADMADGTDLFHETHRNLANPVAALSIESLGKARAAMRKQKGIASKATLNISPNFLLVPAALETAAEQLISSAVDPTKSNATPNPFANKLQIIVDALLDVSSEDAWYLAASPSQIDTIEVAFLNGVRTPVLESRPGWNVDGVEYKVRIDAGAKAIDYRGLYKNAGK